MTKPTTLRLIQKGYHKPLFSDLVFAKLLLVPLLRPARRSPEVDSHKQETRQQRLVEQLALRRGSHGECHIQQALIGVVRADEVSERALLWKSVLL
jgi:hypothetical protein